MSVIKTTGAEHYIVRNNHEWASIVVRCWEAEEYGKTRHCGEILIHSSYGSWANSWGHCGSQFKQFLVGLDFDYLFIKFMGHRFKVFDGELSVRRLRDRLIEARKEGGVTREEARECWDDIEDRESELESSEREFVDAVYAIVHRVDSGRVQRIFCEPWDLIRKSADTRAVGFWSELWPEFKAALQAETAALEVTA